MSEIERAKERDGHPCGAAGRLPLHTRHPCSGTAASPTTLPAGHPRTHESATMRATEGSSQGLERDIPRAARELREERRIERQEWLKIHRFVREDERRRPLIHNGGKARK